MKHEIFTIRQGSAATLTTYIHEDAGCLGKTIPSRPALLICPGGGYACCSEREAEPIALPFFTAGCNVFILDYSVREDARDFKPFLDLFCSIRWIRAHRDEYHINPAQMFTLGFSAGGHLAAAGGVFWKHPRILSAFGVKEEDLPPEPDWKPNGMILCYPVITAGPAADRESIARLCDPDKQTPEEMKKFSLELFVDETTPPAFLWHTANDRDVPVQNSLLFADALARHKVPFELHIYPQGPHGMSLANEETAAGVPAYLDADVAEWPRLAARFIQRLRK